MKYTEAKQGRIFVLRLEDADRLPAIIEEFAYRKKIKRGICILLGGIKGGGSIVTGPAGKADRQPIKPFIEKLSGIHEVAGIGTIFPDEKGRPVLHMHASFGRGKKAKTGCIRPGIDVWKIGEVIIIELIEHRSMRIRDRRTGFELLNIN